MRLEVTRRAELAVRALSEIEHRGGRVKGRELAELLGTSPSFVAQVAAPLVRAGWLRSDPGPTGGYALATAVGDVSVLDVIEAVDGPTDTGRCVVTDHPCDPADPCVLHGAWILAREQLRVALAAAPLPRGPGGPS